MFRSVSERNYIWVEISHCRDSENTGGPHAFTSHKDFTLHQCSWILLPMVPKLMLSKTLFSLYAGDVIINSFYIEYFIFTLLC